MNVRIRRLAQQSQLAELYDRYVEQCIKNADDDILNFDEVVGNFAQLIVQECIDALDKEVYLATREDGEQAFHDVILLEHFGVAE
jgi:hypothetical protein